MFKFFERIFLQKIYWRQFFGENLAPKTCHGSHSAKNGTVHRHVGKNTQCPKF